MPPQQEQPQRTAGTGLTGVNKRDGGPFNPWGGVGVGGSVAGGPAAGGVFPPPSDSPVPRRSAESFRLVIEACRRGGDTRGALSTFAVMREEGFEPDLVSWSELKRSCNCLWLSGNDLFSGFVCREGFFEMLRGAVERAGSWCSSPQFLNC